MKKVLFLISAMLMLFTSCKKTEDEALPRVTIISISNIQETSVTIKCNATFMGGQAITAKGVCWSNWIMDSTKRIINKTNEGAGEGLYTSNITGLNKNAKYFVKAYVASGSDTIYTYNSVFTTAVTKIGDNFKCGLVFYVDSTGQHGLISASADQIIPKTGIQWYNNKFITTSATSTAIGTGHANTVKIATIQGEGSYAVKICTNWVQKGDDGYWYTDWYLPSIDELSLMYKNLFSVNLGNFATGGYWSSTESNVNNAQEIDFVDGGIKSTTKSWTGGVRAIRSF